MEPTVQGVEGRLTKMVLPQFLYRDDIQFCSRCGPAEYGGHGAVLFFTDVVLQDPEVGAHGHSSVRGRWSCGAMASAWELLMLLWLSRKGGGGGGGGGRGGCPGERLENFRGLPIPRRGGA